MQSAAGIQLAIAILISCHELNASIHADMRTYSCMSYGCDCMQDNLQSEGSSAACHRCSRTSFQAFDTPCTPMPAQNTYYMINIEAATHQSKAVDM